MVENRAEIERLTEERKELFAREEQIRHNLSALSTTGDEGALRKRAVAHLQESEDRLDAIQGQIAALQEEIARRQAAIEERLANLQVEV
jgi:ferritin-like metal-binding protein YciE